MPRQDSLPVVGDHPENLFSLLGGSYSLNVHEAVTALCPRSSCPRDRDSVVDRVEFLLTDISTHYMTERAPRNIARRCLGPVHRLPRLAEGRFRELPPRALGSRVDEDASLRARHAPARAVRVPSIWAPLSASLARRDRLGDLGATTRGSCFRATSDTCSRSRTRTSSSGDLSAGFRGGPLRRGRFSWSWRITVRASEPAIVDGAVTETNFGDIANVPLFVKYPYQDDGGAVGLASCPTVDILPTIARRPGCPHAVASGRDIAPVVAAASTASGCRWGRWPDGPCGAGRRDATDAGDGGATRRRSSEEVATRSIESA